MSPRLARALDAVHAGGRSTLKHFQTPLEVERKADSTPVTVADKEAEQIIRAYLAGAFPGESILGEEEGLTGKSSNRWVLDPIDGTKSFICGVPLYATLLSFEEDGVPILGIAYFPAMDELIYAESGAGAFWNGRPCHVSPKASLNMSVISCGSHASMERYNRTDGFKPIVAEALATRTWGDAYGHSLVATGRIEAMVDPVVNLWDISALHCIIQEAGGLTSRFDGKSPLIPVQEGRFEMISSNRILHDTILGAFRP